MPGAAGWGSLDTGRGRKATGRQPESQAWQQRVGWGLRSAASPGSLPSLSKPPVLTSRSPQPWHLPSRRAMVRAPAPLCSSWGPALPLARTLPLQFPLPRQSCSAPCCWARAQPLAPAGSPPLPWKQRDFSDLLRWKLTSIYSGARCCHRNVNAQTPVSGSREVQPGAESCMGPGCLGSSKFRPPGLGSTNVRGRVSPPAPPARLPPD